MGAPPHLSAYIAVREGRSAQLTVNAVTRRAGEKEKISTRSLIGIGSVTADGDRGGSLTSATALPSFGRPRYHVSTHARTCDEANDWFARSLASRWLGSLDCMRPFAFSFPEKCTLYVTYTYMFCAICCILHECIYIYMFNVHNLETESVKAIAKNVFANVYRLLSNISRTLHYFKEEKNIDVEENEHRHMRQYRRAREREIWPVKERQPTNRRVP